MPKQFSPSSRETVIEKANNHEHVFQTVELGPGLAVVYKENRQYERCYTNLMENHGWYCASYEAFEDGDRAVLMPITEVPS